MNTENINIEKLNINAKGEKKTPIIIINWKNKNDWYIRSVSNSTEKVFGYDISKLNSQNFNYENIIYPEDKKIIQEIYETLTQEEPNLLEPKIYRIITKDGEIRWLKEIITIIDHKGTTLYYHRLILDLTEQVKSLEGLQKENKEHLALEEEYKTINEELLISKKEIEKSEKKYRVLAENVSDVIWVFNFTKNKFTYISPSVFQVRGYTVEEAMQLSFIDSLTPESKKIMEKVIPIRLEHFSQGIKRVYRDELQQKSKKGTLIWIEMLTSLQHAEDGSIEVHGISRNTTKRKEAELALKKQNREYLSLNEEYKTINDELLISQKEIKESEKRFKLLSNLTFEGILIHKKGVVLDINNSFLNMSGYSREEIIGKNIINFIIAPEYHKTIREKLASDSSGTYEIEGIHKNGKKTPLELESKLIELHSEKIRVVAVRDITKRKKAEKEIIKLSQAVEQSANTIVIADINGDIEYVNPKFTELTGYTAKEVIGENPRILSADHKSIKEHKKMWEIITAGNVWKGEFKNKTKKGEIFYEKATITPIKNEKGDIINYLAIKEDITEKNKLKKI